MPPTNAVAYVALIRDRPSPARARRAGTLLASRALSCRPVSRPVWAGRLEVNWS